jgi:hypothetical protein
MSKAAQQRVIEEHQATIRGLRQQLAQALADQRDATSVHDRLTTMCDEHEVAGLRVIPIALLRQIRPKGHGLGSST